jgi:Immunity protein 7
VASAQRAAQSANILGMFSAVGWICVQEAEYLDTFGDRTGVPRQPTLDAVEAALDRLVPPMRVVWPKRSLRARLAAVVRQASWDDEPHKPLPGPEALFRADNGMWMVVIDTHRNHRRDWPEQAFREIAQVAPGSFGFLHIWDDEHPTEGEKFMRWSMVLGQVSVEEELTLRPVMEQLLDRYPPGS